MAIDILERTVLRAVTIRVFPSPCSLRPARARAPLSRSRGLPLPEDPDRARKGGGLSTILRGVIRGNGPLSLVTLRLWEPRTPAARASCGLTGGSLGGTLPERMLERRSREAGEDRVDAPVSRHLAVPCLASIIRLTLPVRSSLLMIQQITPIRPGTPQATASRKVGACCLASSAREFEQGSDLGNGLGTGV